MTNNRSLRIANNTLLMYIRSFITMAIGIYSSRVLLKTLGIDDYGIYNLVGGVVAMFTSIKTIFASSTQRFLNHEKGMGNDEGVNKVFNISLFIHVILAVFFAIIVEGFGLWFISHKLTVPDGSLPDALFVFHFSVLNAVILIMTTPFNAAIIANERINVFAWVYVADSALKLLIIYLVPLLMFRYLRSYASLMILIGLANLLFCMWYCRKFPECRFAFYRDKKLFIRVSSFAGWNFLGNSVFSLVNEGINFILNFFGGVAINAARGISQQVKNSINTLCTNLFVAVQPFVIQEAAFREKEVIFGYTFRISRLMFLIVLMTVCPLILYCDTVLRVWLVEPPYMAGIFMRLMLIHLVQRSLHSPIDLLFKSFGDIKWYQIIDGATLILSLPLSYAALRLGMPLYTAFVIVCLVELVNLTCILLCARRQLGLSLVQWLRRVGLYSVGAAAAIAVLNIGIGQVLHPSTFFGLCLAVLLIVAAEAMLAYFVLLNKRDKHFVLDYAKSVVMRKR